MNVSDVSTIPFCQSLYLSISKSERTLLDLEIERYIHQRSMSFIAGRKKTKDLKNLHRAFLVIPPTSVESPRVDFAAGLFLSRLRTRMGDQTFSQG